MSKTIVIMDAPDNALSIETVGEENPYFLGAFGEVISVLRHFFPQADFTDPTQISAQTEKGIISIEIAKHTPVQSFMMHLENADAMELVKSLCEKTNWRALDTDTGMFIESRKTDSSDKDSNVQKSWWKLWKR